MQWLFNFTSNGINYDLLISTFQASNSLCTSEAKIIVFNYIKLITISGFF